MIIRRETEPSRPDAEKLTRRERDSVLFLMNAVCILEDMGDDLRERWQMIPDGEKRMRAEEQDKYGCNKEKERQIWRKMRWR